MSIEDKALHSNYFPWSKKVAVVEKYLAIGNMRLVAEIEDVAYSTITEWKKSTWWPQLIEEIKTSRRNKKALKISDLVDTSLEVLADRLENGDYVLNNKTGKIERRPVSLRDVQSMTNTLLARQIQLEELTDKMESRGDNNIADTLKFIANEMQKMVKKLPKSETIDVIPVEKEEE